MPTHQDGKAEVVRPDLWQGCHAAFLPRRVTEGVFFMKKIRHTIFILGLCERCEKLIEMRFPLLDTKKELGP